jgi:hypothetical protein
MTPQFKNHAHFILILKSPHKCVEEDNSSFMVVHVVLQAMIAILQQLDVQLDV